MPFYFKDKRIIEESNKRTIREWRSLYRGAPENDNLILSVLVAYHDEEKGHWVKVDEEKMPKISMHKSCFKAAEIDEVTAIILTAR